MAAQPGFITSSTSSRLFSIDTCSTSKLTTFPASTNSKYLFQARNARPSSQTARARPRLEFESVDIACSYKTPFLNNAGPPHLANNCSLADTASESQTHAFGTAPIRHIIFSFDRHCRSYVSSWSRGGPRGPQDHDDMVHWCHARSPLGHQKPVKITFGP